jgi:cysteine desulfurase
LPEVLEAMLPFFMEHYGNSLSIHTFGLYARDAIKEARKDIAQLINAETSEQIYFTSDITEAANWAVKGSAEALKRYGNHIIISDIEHPSILESANWLEKQGFTITRLKVDSAGNIDINSYEIKYYRQNNPCCYSDCKRRYRHNFTN